MTELGAELTFWAGILFTLGGSIAFLGAAGANKHAAQEYRLAADLYSSISGLVVSLKEDDGKSARRVRANSARILAELLSGTKMKMSDVDDQLGKPHGFTEGMLAELVDGTGNADLRTIGEIAHICFNSADSKRRNDQ